MKIQERLTLKDPEALARHLEKFIAKAVENGRRNGCILGNSGGLDSAVTAFLAVRALGRERVKMLFMPERDSSKKSYGDALKVSEALEVPLKVIRLTPLIRKIGAYGLEPPTLFMPRRIQEKYVTGKHEKYSDPEGPAFLKTLQGGAGNPELQRDIAYYSVKHRLRMTLLYYYGEMENRMVLGTCNRSEKMTGLFIKYGDGASDLDPLAGLYKTEVFQLAKHLKVPASVVEKLPAGDLAPGLTDEQTLHISYERLDMILAGLDMGLGEAEIAGEAGVDASSIDYVKKLTAASWHMRRLPLEPDNI